MIGRDDFHFCPEEIHIMKEAGKVNLFRKNRGNLPSCLCITADCEIEPTFDPWCLFSQVIFIYLLESESFTFKNT